MRGKPQSVKTHIAQIITLLGITSSSKQVKRPVTFRAQLSALIFSLRASRVIDFRKRKALVSKNKRVFEIIGFICDANRYSVLLTRPGLQGSV